MHRNRLIELLQRYSPSSAEDQATKDRFLNFVQSEPACFERSLTHGHVTASAWLIDRQNNSVLLTHHRKLNKWLQLGGHADGCADVLEVAKTEALEESGISDFVTVTQDIFDLDIHEIPQNPKEAAHFHYDVRFIFQLNGSSQFKVSEESIDLAWVPFDKVSSLSTDTSVLKLLKKTETFLNEKNHH